MLEVVIIGSGFGGIISAIRLLKAGIDDFVLLERDEQMGGTWWRNSYPGAAVDVPSILYSISGEPHDWTRAFALQEEILDYTNKVIDKYELRSRTRLKAEVVSMNYQDASASWVIKTSDGQSYESRNVINASGGLSQAKIPAFEGLDSFRGKTMHTSQWDHSFDYENKRVAVIGTGASAVQVIPSIVEKVKKLEVFQRTPHWILKRPDRIFSSWERKLRKKKWINTFLRNAMYLFMEWRILGFRYFPAFLDIVPTLEAKAHIRKSLDTKELQGLMTPEYRPGCKRILMSNEYYQVFNEAKVVLRDKSQPIACFYENGIALQNGQEIPLDLVIFATGFHAAENNIPYPIIGKEGRSIEEEWKSAAHAFWGTMVPGFPNLFLISGPNTGIGHTSALVMIEAQLDYVIRMIKHKKANEKTSIEVRRGAEEAFNEKIQKALKGTVWQSGGCKSWYQRADGKNTTLYPDFTIGFIRNCRNARFEDHIFS